MPISSGEQVIQLDRIQSELRRKSKYLLGDWITGAKLSIKKQAMFLGFIIRLSLMQI